MCLKLQAILAVVTEETGPMGRSKEQRDTLALVFLFDLRQESHIAQASLKLAK